MADEVPEDNKRYGFIIVQVEKRYYVDQVDGGTAIRAFPNVVEAVRSIERTILRAPSQASAVLYMCQTPSRAFEMSLGELKELCGGETARAYQLRSSVYFGSGVLIPDDEKGKALFEAAIQPKPYR